VAATVLPPEDDEDEAQPPTVARPRARDRRRTGMATDVRRRVVVAEAMSDSVRGARG
jgi:hypothetical protein